MNRLQLQASIIIAVSLGLGAIAAVTAYLPRIEAVADAVARGDTITLAADAGSVPGENGVAEPMFQDGEELKVESVVKLQNSGVKRVAVREFSLGRWTHSWMFGLGVIGLAIGARMLKQAAKPRAGQVSAATANAPEPRDLLVTIQAELEEMHLEFENYAETEEGRQAFIDRLTELQGGAMAAFADSRERLIGAYGMSGFAAIMSAFSVLERQVNRAWSAAADGVFDETRESIARAHELIGDLERAMA